MDLQEVSDKLDTILSRLDIIEQRLSDVERISDVERLNECGETPLMTAVRDEQPDMNRVQSLIQDGADINRRDSDGWTALMHANSVEAIKFLINNRADINAVDDRGRTALIINAEGGESALCKYLVELGADPDIKDNDNYTADDYLSIRAEYRAWGDE